MKICTKCEKEKCRDDFNKNKQSKSGLSSWCTTCIRENSKVFYKKNRKRLIEKVRGYQNKKREWFIELKESLFCEKCGENHISCLDFHHINPKNKKFGISEGLTRLNYPKKEILKEIKKCIVVCKNCHAKIHYNENKSSNR